MCMAIKAQIYIVEKKSKPGVVKVSTNVIGSSRYNSVSLTRLLSYFITHLFKYLDIDV